MPATIPSHPGFVLPLKLWRPGWFDGVALVVGSAIPDLVYVGGCCEPPQTYGHAWWGTVALVPVVLVLAWLMRWAAPTVVAHLPSGGPLALHDYGVLGRVRHPWWRSAASAWIGALSHVATDHITHASVDGTGLGLAALNVELVAGVPWWMPVHLLSTAIGALVCLAVIVHIGRRRLLVRWHGPAPEVPRALRRFWVTFAVASAGGLMLGGGLTAAGAHEQLVGFLPSLPRPVVVVIRAAAALFVAALVATLVTRRARPAKLHHSPVP